MSSKINKIFIPILILADLMMVILGFRLAFYIRFESKILAFPVFPSLFSYFLVVFAFLPIWLLVFYFYRLYDSDIIFQVSGEYSRILQATIFGIMLFMIGSFFLKHLELARGWILISFFTTLFLITLNRFIIRNIIFYLRKKDVIFYETIIVGANEDGKLIAEQIEKHPFLGLRIVGFVDDVKDIEDKVYKEIKVLGRTDDLLSIIKNMHIEEVIFISSAFSREKTFELVQKIERLHIRVQIFEELYDIVLSRISITDIGGLPLAILSKSPLRGFNLFLKNAFDFIVSLIILIILSPVMLISALLIKLTSKGPIFYKQERVGRSGYHFNVLKFRTMRAGAEEETGPVWATKSDPRRTKVGKILRKLSIDELPQLINVLKGNMSLVGPRPERPYFVEEFKNSVNKYMERHRVKCGITGWAQVNGLRGDTSVEDRIKYDNYYIENWSFGLDLKILLRTILVVIFQKEAY